jgi:hypothetical protein
MMAIADLLAHIKNDLGPYCIALAALGTFSMALVQNLKNLTPVRLLFQQRRTRRWLIGRIAEARSNLGISSTVMIGLIESELIAISTGGSLGAFYGADSDGLYQELGAVARLVLNYPAGHGRYVPYSEVLAVIASSITKTDFDLLVGARTGSRQEILDAHNRVQLEMLQVLSAFQMANDWLWKNLLHASAFIICWILACVAFWTELPCHFFRVSLSAFLAALLAPVARDVVASLEKLRS